uniref:Uncharacterized protein n=1 Tax=Arundo donax TaxID=35708 RepID=A0A0A8ZMH8_ARUDO
MLVQIYTTIMHVHENTKPVATSSQGSPVRQQDSTASLGSLKPQDY